jgi:di/tricarboxylate transporter
MTWEIVFVLALLVFAVVSFITEKVSADVTALIVFAVILGAGTFIESDAFPSLSATLGVFSNHAPLTVAGMFIVSAALTKTGAVDLITGVFRVLIKLPLPIFMFCMIMVVAAMSAFINNTPVVVVLLPVMLSVAREMGTHASRLLIPLSYASIFGGTCTLIGTSTNLIGSGILSDYGYEPIGMYEISRIGVPILFVGAIYLVIFSGKLIPKRETISSILSDEERKEFITEAFVRHGSPLIGETLDDSGLLKERHLRILEIVRNGIAVPGNPRKIKLSAGDRLVLSCRPSGVIEAHETDGIEVLGEVEAGLEQIAAEEGALVEGMVAPQSTIVGKSIQELAFRQRFRMVVVAVHRKGQNLRSQLDSLRLQDGDTLLLMGSNQAIERLRGQDEIILLDRPRTPAANYRRKMPFAIAITAGLVTAASLNIMPIVAATTIAVVLFLLTGCLKPKEAYASVEWSILIIIYGMLALGQAMDISGASALIANSASSGIQAVAPVAWQPILILAMVYLVTSIFTEFLSNNAAVALMAPIAIGLAVSIGIDPRPLVIAICIAGSASFATPIGYQTNTYVYGVGGYKFSDFARIGIPLNILYFVTSVVLIPRIWPF